MRILHSSDWHLGRSLHRVPLIEAQRAFLEALTQTVEREQVDVVVVAGDVYDRAIPPLEAIDLFDTVLLRLAELKVPLVMISGNHDSPRRLGVGSKLIELAGIHLRTNPADCARPVVLEDSDGPVAFYGLPYLEPGLVRESLGAESAHHHAVLGVAMDQIRADLATRPGTRSVVLAHAFVTGGSQTDSERDITAGGICDVPKSVFDGVDYVALGHLHGSQELSDRVRYSGSPLPYSFSEADHVKSMWLIDLDAAGAVTGREVPCPAPYRLEQVKGDLDTLLADSAYSSYEDVWLHAILTDPSRPHMAIERLRQRFPHVLRLTFDSDGPSADMLPSREHLEGMTDHEVVLAFLHHVTQGDPTDAEADLLRQGIEEIRIAAQGESI